MVSIPLRTEPAIYDQGDIVEVNFSPSLGHEPQKLRPALVVSSYEFNLSNSMTIVCPITTRMRPFPLHETLPEDCCVCGSVVMEQLRALDLDARPCRLLGRLDDETLDKIITCIRSFF